MCWCDQIDCTGHMGRLRALTETDWNRHLRDNCWIAEQDEEEGSQTAAVLAASIVPAVSLYAPLTAVLSGLGLVLLSTWATTGGTCALVRMLSSPRDRGHLMDVEYLKRADPVPVTTEDQTVVQVGDMTVFKLRKYANLYFVRADLLDTVPEDTRD